MIPQVTSRPAEVQHLRDLARLRRVRDRIDREYPVSGGDRTGGRERLVSIGKEVLHDG